MSSASLPDGITPRPWPEFSAELLALYQPPMRAPATLGAIRYTLEHVAALGVQSTAELTPKLVAAYIASCPQESPNTTHSKVAYLRVVANYAAAMGYVRVSPFTVRKRWVRKAPSQRKRHHSRETIARILDLARTEAATGLGWARWRRHRLYVLMATVAYTGLRRNEALRLRREDIDLPGRLIWVRARRGNALKTEASAAPVPIAEPLASILAEWFPCLELPTTRGNIRGPRPRANPDGTMDSGWVFPNAYRTGPWVGGSHFHRPVEELTKLGKRAGVEGLTFLSLRHSWATAAEGLGLSEEQIKRVLRHTSVRTQVHYRHADEQNLRETIRGFGFGAASEGPPE